MQKKISSIKELDKLSQAWPEFVLVVAKKMRLIKLLDWIVKKMEK